MLYTELLIRKEPLGLKEYGSKAESCRLRRPAVNELGGTYSDHASSFRIGGYVP
jgi:hypothetical protein